MHKSDEWELSKENIQPLRQGRKMEILKSALKSVSDGEQHRVNLEKQKMEFESELRSYNGNDPLAPWISYINWTEQNFPKGGLEGSLMQLLEKCISEFIEQSAYKNDERFIDVCLKLANMADDSLEMFNFMYGKGVGRTVASFYIAWSLALEAAGNIKKADNVFLKGLQKGAEPTVSLEMRYREFQARIMLTSQLQDDVNSDDEVGRVPMSSLKTYGNKKLVGTTRMGSVISNSNQCIARNPVPNLPKGTTFVVCHDENDPEQLCDSGSVGGPIGIPMSNAESRKENEKKPGKWSNVKMRSKVAPTPGRTSSKFNIHTDEDELSPVLLQETPMKRDCSLNLFVPLSVKKEQKRVSAFQKSPNQLVVSKPKQIHMYRSDLVNRGLQEFQFEEVRFAIYKQKQKERENERLQKEQSEKLRMMEEKVATMERTQKQLFDFVVEFLKSTGKPASVEIVGNLLKMMGQLATEQEVQDVTNKYNETLLEQDVEIDESEKESIESDSNATVAEKSLIHPIVSSVNRSHYSETIHTKEAFKIAIGIINMEEKTSQIALDSNPTLVPMEDSTSAELKHIPKKRSPIVVFEDPREDSSAELQPVNKKRSSIVVFEDPMEGSNAGLQETTKQTSPNVVFEDPVEANQPSTVQQSTMPFVIFTEVTADNVENCQNVPPDGYVQVTEKRELAGFLEPSFTVPFKPLAELDPDPDSEEEQDLVGIQPLSQPDCSSFIMPTNTLFFTNNAKLVSTPIAAFVSSSTSSSLLSPSPLKVASKMLGKECSTRCDVPTNEDKLEPSKHYEDMENGKTISLALLPRRSLVPHGGETKYLDLSTIVETSRDYKSSSSGSSGTSSAATSHFRSTLSRHKTHGEASTVLDKSEKLKEAVDPFDTTLINGFLNSLGASAMRRNDITVNYCKLPTLTPNTVVNFVSFNYVIVSKIRSGAYASVFRAFVTEFEVDFMSREEEDSVALKVQKPAWPWEFYICDTLHNRLQEGDFAVDVTPSIMKISRMFFYEDGSIIETEYHDKGTLLDLVNMYTNKKETMPEILVLYFTVEILRIIEAIHRCQIIHADIKPDNFMFISRRSIDLQTNATGSLKLIDFGRSIDMTLFPSGTEFTRKVETDGFDCIEMKEGRHWTYQTDLYGVAACTHVMLFGKYMYPMKMADGTWKITSTIRRYWNSAVWHSFFNQLLNIPSGDQLPNLTEIQTSLARCITDTKKLSQEYTKLVKGLR